MMLAGGAALTTTVGQSSKRVLIEPRLKAAVGYVPYFGQSILPAFGRDQRGVDGVALPYLAIAGGADLLAPVAQIEDGMVRLGSTRAAGRAARARCTDSSRRTRRTFSPGRSSSSTDR